MTQIDVNITFPGGDLGKKPTVTNSTTQDNTIAADQTSLIWKADMGDDELELTGVTFFASQPQRGVDGKYTTPTYEPPFLDVPGGHVTPPGTLLPDKTSWQVSFKPGVTVSKDTALWYDLQFKDKDFSGLDWDPKLTIKPR